MAVEEFRDAEPDRARVRPEQLVKHRDVVRHQGRLVPVEDGAHLRHDNRVVDLHCRSKHRAAQTPSARSLHPRA
jgi:hypothetical protein